MPSGAKSTLDCRRGCASTYCLHKEDDFFTGKTVLELKNTYFTIQKGDEDIHLLKRRFPACSLPTFHGHRRAVGLRKIDASQIDRRDQCRIGGESLLGWPRSFRGRRSGALGNRLCAAVQHRLRGIDRRRKHRERGSASGQNEKP